MATSSGTSQGSSMRSLQLLTGGANFCDNRVITSHYTIFTFVPKNLLEQFSLPANIWFLVLSILQMIPRVSTTGGIPTILAPLCCIVAANALKDAIEDRRRHVSDREENERIVLSQASSTARCASEKWQNLRVGSLVVVKNNEYIPADLVIVASAHDEGHCFVETMNLDGETNLKTKQAPKASFAMVSEWQDMDAAVKKASLIQGSIECEEPNEFLYSFVGTLQARLDGKEEKIALDPEHVLLRGCKVKNVPWVIGFVVYSGKETKIMMNSKEKKGRKVSHLEHDVGRLTLLIFFLQLFLCLIAAVGNIVTRDQNAELSYLDVDDDESAFFVLIIRFLNFLILFANFIPISLIVSINGVKFVQVFFFYSDETMIHRTPHQDIHCMPRTSDLNEELGQVEYVFSDKTGTLTCNVMDFRKFYVAGVMYGEGMTEIRRNVLAKMGKTVELPPPPKPGAKKTPHVDLVDSRLDELLAKQQGEHYQQVRRFLLHLAINHEVVTDTEDGKLTYSASSPDESALCYGARHFGYMFKSRNSEGVRVELPDQTMLDVKVKVILKFNSTRKRSSVIVEYLERQPDGSSQLRLWLYTKGADSVIMERLCKKEMNSPEWRKADATLKDMSLDGLRTLCLAGRELKEAEFDAWYRNYQEASVATKDREAKLDAAAEEIENDLEFHGITGIEDRLQDGVPDTVEKMFKAGIKVWMLTGDKVETAINIGIATGLLEPDSPDGEKRANRLVLTSSDFEVNGVLEPKAVSSRLQQAADRCVQEGATQKTEQSGSFQRFISQLKNIGGGRPYVEPLYEGMVIDGRCLEIALEPQNAQNFVSITRVCRTVVCCRVSPKQKGAVVRLIKEEEKAMTLAIGDGANDCNMIQSADVGIGIRGLEGLQAFNVCDYGVGQFRFLQTLLFVHGRWCYRRIAVLANYTFYKNIVVVMPQYFLGFVSDFSGQKLYSDFMYQAYNVCHTFVPIVLFGIIDQDVSREVSLRHPELYGLGLTRSYLNPKVSGTWILSGIWHSVVIFTLPYCIMSNGNITHSDGKANDIWMVGAVIYLLVTVVTNVVVIMETCNLTWITWFGVFLSALGWGSMHLVLSGAATGSVWMPELHGTTERMFSCPTIWLTMITVVALSLLPDLQAKAAKCIFYPTTLHKVQEKVLEGTS